MFINHVMAINKLQNRFYCRILIQIGISHHFYAFILATPIIKNARQVQNQYYLLMLMIILRAISFELIFLHLSWGSKNKLINVKF